MLALGLGLSPCLTPQAGSGDGGGGGYTAQAGNIFGYWRDSAGHDSYGEHREFSVAFVEDAKLPMLKTFVAKMAAELEEECIYLRAGGTASLIYPARIG